MHDIESNSDLEFLIGEVRTEYKTNLSERLLNFSVTVIRFLGELPIKKEMEVLKYQLSKSATSIGANF